MKNYTESAYNRDMARGTQDIYRCYTKNGKHLTHWALKHGYTELIEKNGKDYYLTHDSYLYSVKIYRGNDCIDKLRSDTLKQARIFIKEK